MNFTFCVVTDNYLTTLSGNISSEFLGIKDIKAETAGQSVILGIQKSYG